MEQNLFESMPFIPGMVVNYPEPLEHYLPHTPNGVITEWLHKNIQPGSWILDPFGISPRFDVEAARAGYKLLVTANNPITRFILEMFSNPPKAEDLKSVIATLGASYKADERMEPHILSLYNTHCSRCGRIVSADAFLWEHGSPSPYMRIYTCPYCGDSGEYPCTQYDAELANQFSSGGLHKARALERVVATTDQDRIHVEQALSVYTPRALYALITIINKVEGLNITPIEQKNLAALLLYAFDLGSAMWRESGSRERRRQLSIPRHFRENNIWFTLEQGINLWSFNYPLENNYHLPITTWPTEPPITGGICVFEGRLVSIYNSLKNINIKAVCTVIPRPNQAFWTLSALWTGWLWGREAVGSFKSVLHRQRYDWGWHTTALTSVFKLIANILDPSSLIIGCMSEVEPGFVASVLIAAGIAGCSLEGIAIRPEEDQAQIVWKWRKNPEPAQIKATPIESSILAAKRYLESRGEPASYLNTITAAFINIIQLTIFQQEQSFIDKKSQSEMQVKMSADSDQYEISPSVVYSKIYNSAREALSYRSGFLRFNLQDVSAAEASPRNQIGQGTLFSLETEDKRVDEEEASTLESLSSEEITSSEKERPTRSSDISESTLLWLRETDYVNHLSISDRFEMDLVDYLAYHPGSSLEDIDKSMCNFFPGLFTPDPEFIRTCLESYGEQDSLTNRWHIRHEDKPEERILDLERSHNYLHQIADRLGITYRDHLTDGLITSISWLDTTGNLDFWFFTTTTATIGKIVLYNDLNPSKGIIVLPGSRANLVIYRLRRDPRLNKAFNLTQGNWRFLKFRHLKSLVENPLLRQENLGQFLELDPLTYSTLQMRLI